MPRGYRRVFAALAGLAALFWAFSAGFVGGSLNYPEQQRYESYRYATDKPQEIDPTLDQAEAKRLEYREPCSDPKGKDESDLCAQWKAARAAEVGALWAARSFWVGLGGVIGLIFSLYYTRKAVIAAEDATRDADTAIAISERNAKAAKRLWRMLAKRLFTG